MVFRRNCELIDSVIANALAINQTNLLQLQGEFNDWTAVIFSRKEKIPVWFLWVFNQINFQFGFDVRGFRAILAILFDEIFDILFLDDLDICDWAVFVFAALCLDTYHILKLREVRTLYRVSIWALSCLAVSFGGLQEGLSCTIAAQVQVAQI